MQLQNFLKKQKCLNMWRKMPYVDVIDPKCLISIFFGKSFRKTIVIFEISSLKWVYLQNFTKKKKKSQFGTRYAWFGYFGSETWKQHCHTWNQHHQIYLTSKLRGKTKMPKFGTKTWLTWMFLTKKALFGYF